MGIKIQNNAWGVLSTQINAVDTTIILQTGHGSNFPALTAGDYFYATLIDTSNNLEIVKITARTNDTLTVATGGRGQDGTTARTYAAGCRLELRVCASTVLDVIAEAKANSVINTAEVDVSSAATADIGAAASMNVRITGTTGITSFGTAANGLHRSIRFAGALTLANSANLILPSGANITTAANDTAEAMSLGSGVWIVLMYQKSDGKALVSPTVPVTSVGGYTGAVTAAQIAAAATAGYGYTPANAATLNFLSKDMGHNNVGSLCFAGRTVQNGTTISTGGTVAGSSLIAAGIGIAGTGGYNETSTIYTGSVMSGTWRCLGVMPNDSGWASQITLFQRIS